MAKLYIAGKLWEKEDRKKVEEIDRLCKSLGHETFLPHRDAGIYKEGMDSEPIFKKDRDMVDWCDAIIALLDWKGISSGTAWELGYGYAKKKKIICLVEDKKSVNKEFRTCVMCFNSGKLIESLEELKKELKNIFLLKKTDKIISNSKLTESDCLKLGEQLKDKMWKRYKKEGW